MAILERHATYTSRETLSPMKL